MDAMPGRDAEDVQFLAKKHGTGEIVHHRARQRSKTVVTEATAEADAIRLVTKQLGRSPQYVDLVRAKRWDGELPQTVLGEGVGAFLSMPAQRK